MWLSVSCTASRSQSSVIFEGIFPEARLMQSVFIFVVNLSFSLVSHCSSTTYISYNLLLDIRSKGSQCKTSIEFEKFMIVIIDA